MYQSYQLVLLLSLTAARATAFSWRDSGYYSQRQKSTTTTSSPSYHHQYQPYQHYQEYDGDYYYDYDGRWKMIATRTDGISLLYFYINIQQPLNPRYKYWKIISRPRLAFLVNLRF